MITIPPATQAAITSHAIAAHPQEACGILAAPTNSEEISTIYAATNASSRPGMTFLISPRDQMEIEQEIADRGERMAAVYHSHNRSAAIPSESDLIFAARLPGVAQVIVSLAHDELRCYELVGGQLLERDPDTGDPIPQPE